MKKTKKLPTKQLEKYSTVFTQLGLVLALFIVHVILEHKTLEKPLAQILKPLDYDDSVYIPDDRPLVIVIEPKKPIKTKVEIVKPKLLIIDEFVTGDNDVIESLIDIANIDQPIKVTDIVEVYMDEEPEPETVDFIKIEDAPVFKGCEGLSKKENKKCFEKKIKQFFIKRFDANLAEDIGLRSGKHKIFTEFVIGKDGFISDIQIRAPHIRLKKETQKIIEKLPKFTPGMQRKKPVKMKYVLPISFKVE
jgi:protein TonB